MGLLTRTLTGPEFRDSHRTWFVLGHPLSALRSLRSLGLLPPGVSVHALAPSLEFTTGNSLFLKETLFHLFHDENGGLEGWSSLLSSRRTYTYRETILCICLISGTTDEAFLAGSAADSSHPHTTPKPG